MSYLPHCFTFDDINLNRAFIIIFLFPKIYSNKKVCANFIGKRNASGFYWKICFSFIVIISTTFFLVENFTFWYIG